jgi:O-antigen/teichoic acid export membrane protein
VSEGTKATDVPAKPASRGLMRRPARRRDGPKTGAYSLLLRDSVLYGGGRMLQKFLSALLLPLYTSFLGPADYGVLGMVLVTTTLIDVVVVLGFDIAFTRFYFDDKSQAHRDQVITVEFWVSTIYPAVLLGMLALFMPQISSILMSQSGYAYYFDLGLANVFFTNMSAVPFTLYRLEHKPYTFLAFNIARILIQIPLTVVLVVAFHQGVQGVLIGNVVTSFLLNTVAMPSYWHHITWRLHWDLTKKMTTFAVPAVFSGLIFFLLKLSDRFFLMRYWGKDEVGVYTAAFTISQPVYMVMSAFRMAWPQWHFAKLHDPVKHKLMVARSSTYFLFFCTLMLVAQGIWMPLTVRVLLRNHGFWRAGPTALILTAATVFYSAYFVFWVGSNVAKKNRLVPLVTAVASGLNVGFNLLLIPHFGMIAAAWTTFAGYAVLAALIYPISRRYYPIPYEWARLIKMSVAAGAALAIGWGIGTLTGESVSMPFGQLAVREVAKLPAFFAFFGLLWAMRFFTKGEGQAIRARGARLLRLGRGRAPATGPAGLPAAEEPVLDAENVALEVNEAEDDELELETEAQLDINETASPT